MEWYKDALSAKDKCEDMFDMLRLHANGWREVSNTTIDALISECIISLQELRSQVKEVNQ